MTDIHLGAAVRRVRFWIPIRRKEEVNWLQNAKLLRRRLIRAMLSAG